MKKISNSDFVIILKFFNDTLSSFYYMMDKCLSFLNSDPYFKDNPVFWNIPLYPVMEHEYGSIANIIQIFKIRMEHTGDAIIPKGYTGAYHSLLLRDELEEEIHWSFSNPWAQNRLEEFNIATHLLMPSDVDFFRPECKPFYQQSPYEWIITPAFSSHSSSLSPVTIISHKKTKIISAACLVPFRSVAEKPPFKLFKRQIPSKIIICECTDSDIVNSLQFISESIRKLIKKGVTVTLHNRLSLDRIPQLTPKQSLQQLRLSGESALFQTLPFIDFPLPAVPFFPSQRFFSHTACKKRYKRLQAGEERDHPAEDEQRKEAREDERVINFPERRDLEEESLNGEDERERKEILLFTAGLKEETEDDEGEKTPEQRNFLANMTGTTQLNESNYIVELTGGRFQNIIIDGKRTLSDQPVTSFIKLNDTIYYDHVTAFSFEDSSEERGLREIIRWESPSAEKDGKILNDYIFLGDYPYLFISMYVYYPVFRESCTVSSYGLFELPLFGFQKGEAVRIQGVYPDGKSYTYFIPAEEQIIDFPGTQFFFSSVEATFMICFPHYGEIPIEVLPVRVSKEKKQYTLFINPRGSYRSTLSDRISGYEEHFIMMVGAGTKEKINPGTIPPRILERLQPSWIRKSPL